MVSPNNNAKRANVFDVSKSPLRKTREDFRSNGLDSKTNHLESTPVNKSNYELKSPKSGIRDLILSKSNNENSFQDLLKKSNTKEFKSIGNVSTNDRSRSSFKMNSNSDN